MRNLVYSAIISLSAMACTQTQKSNTRKDINNHSTSRFFSKYVKDSFSIFVSLPADYSPENKKIYPVVYILDANLYFDIVSVIAKKYSEVGLLSSVILVGIGYQSFLAMDSLRSRDYTYPIAIPEYEMSLSGGADKFLSFIKDELMADIDNKYQVDKTRRILMGHSLGGYFVLYALQQNLSRTDSSFFGYVAASPSIHYNHSYLLHQFQNLSAHNNRSKVYVTFGGIEDTENAQDTAMPSSNKVFQTLSLSLKQKDSITFLGEPFSNLGHMGTQLPTFVKGLQWILDAQ